MKLKGMDIFISRSSKFSGWFIRLVSSRSFRKAKSKKVGNHTGFLVSDYGWIAAKEMVGNRFKHRSLRYYRGKRNKIIYVWRWSVFDKDGMREKAQRRLAEILDKGRKYDWWVLLGYVFPNIKNNPNRDICSENIFLVLKEFGLEGYPPQWDKQPPSPYDWQLFLLKRHDFTIVSA